jgi:hypothetical protein
VVGFQHVFDPAVAQLKQRLLGHGPRPRWTATSAVVTCCWPRHSGYYNRTSWAGRWSADGVWVLDGPIHNAMSHHVHLALFLLGATPESCARPTRIHSRLYRANPIESYDTATIHIETLEGVQITCLLTHACQSLRAPRITITTDCGLLTVQPDSDFTSPDGSGSLASPDQLRQNLVDTVSLLHLGQKTVLPIATLECSRELSVAATAPVQSGQVIAVPSSWVSTTVDPQGNTQRAIRGIEDVFESATAGNRTPTLPLWDWSPPSVTLSLGTRWNFTSPATG